jgi:hypothetical protein
VNVNSNSVKMEPVAAPLSLAPRTPLVPPTLSERRKEMRAGVLQAKLDEIRIHKVEIVAKPKSQPGKTTIPAIRIHRVYAPVQQGMPRALHTKRESISRSLESRKAREARRLRTNGHQSSLRDHRGMEVACV